jgi:hypothetical protein
MTARLLETIKDSITQKQLRSRTGRFRHLQDDPERIQEYNEKINRALEKFKVRTAYRVDKHQLLSWDPSFRPS